MLPCYILNTFTKKLGPLEDKFTPRLTIHKVCEIYFLLSSQFVFLANKGMYCLVIVILFQRWWVCLPMQYTFVMNFKLCSWPIPSIWPLLQFQKTTLQYLEINDKQRICIEEVPLQLQWLKLFNVVWMNPRCLRLC